ncbi:hypothetical protein BTVI_154148 [Pitangus sulphuratus]|nr:hypothetical protein BTVI_154148 [Pitangus sulphuratus]
MGSDCRIRGWVDQSDDGFYWMKMKQNDEEGFRLVLSIATNWQVNLPNCFASFLVRVVPYMPNVNFDGERGYLHLIRAKKEWLRQKQHHVGEGLESWPPTEVNRTVTFDSNEPGFIQTHAFAPAPKITDLGSLRGTCLQNTQKTTGETADEDHLIHLFYTDVCVFTKDGGPIQDEHSSGLAKKCS